MLTECGSNIGHGQQKRTSLCAELDMFHIEYFWCLTHNILKYPAKCVEVMCLPNCYGRNIIFDKYLRNDLLSFVMLIKQSLLRNPFKAILLSHGDKTQSCIFNWSIEDRLPHISCKTEYFFFLK